MVKRKKRLKKGIESLKKQREIHLQKKEIAKKLRQEELVRYYDNEIIKIEGRKRDREQKLKRK